MSEKISAPRELTGIERAIKAVGTQVILAEKLRAASGQRIGQGRITDWVRRGHVPAARAPIVAELTGIPLEDLLRSPKPKAPPRGKATERRPE